MATEEYRDYVATLDGDLPIFHEPWWLDATCGDSGWDVALAKKDSAIQATLPYQRLSARGIKFQVQPALTPFLGPHIPRGQGSHTAELSRQKDLMTALIDDRPDNFNYVQNWSPELTNWLPFYWRGFQQTTQYTYQLTDLSNEDDLWANLRGSIRREIRKATEREGLVVRSDVPLEQFLALNTLSFERQGLRRPYGDDYVERIDQACAERGRRRIFLAEDSTGRPHAAAYLVWDAHRAYYLMGGGDPEVRTSGAASLCMWDAIRFAATVTGSFDFEGSMLEPVERFFRAFGAEQVPYFAVSGFHSRIAEGRIALQAAAARRSRARS